MRHNRRRCSSGMQESDTPGAQQPSQKGVLRVSGTWQGVSLRICPTPFKDQLAVLCSPCAHRTLVWSRRKAAFGHHSVWCCSSGLGSGLEPQHVQPFSAVDLTSFSAHSLSWPVFAIGLLHRILNHEVTLPLGWTVFVSHSGTHSTANTSERTSLS